MLRASVDYSEEERRRLRAELDAMYGQFVTKVAAGRSLDPDAAEASAQGRVWLGADARPRGLVDELGPVEAALRLARSLAGEVGARARVFGQRERRTQRVHHRAHLSQTQPRRHPLPFPRIVTIAG